MRIISVRESPEYCDRAVEYLSSRWSVPRVIYHDCVTHALTASGPLPKWYLLVDEDVNEGVLGREGVEDGGGSGAGGAGDGDGGGAIVGCAGLITNDFISRMDLWPWVCALFVEPACRGRALGSLLLEKAATDSRRAGFEKLYLCTDHTGYYEKYGFRYLAQGYHPWGEESRIYVRDL